VGSSITKLGSFATSEFLFDYDAFHELHAISVRLNENNYSYWRLVMMHFVRRKKVWNMLMDVFQFLKESHFQIQMRMTLSSACMSGI